MNLILITKVVPTPEGFVAWHRCFSEGKMLTDQVTEVPDIEFAYLMHQEAELLSIDFFEQKEQ